MDNCLDGDFMRKKEHFYAILCPEFWEHEYVMFYVKNTRKLKQTDGSYITTSSQKWFQGNKSHFDGHL